MAIGISTGTFFCYNNRHKDVKSMELNDIIGATTSSMVAERASGTTVDKYLEEIDKKIEDIMQIYTFARHTLARCHITNMICNPSFANISSASQNASIRRTDSRFFELERVLGCPNGTKLLLRHSTRNR